MWTVWNKAGELPEHVSKRQAYNELMQIICELGMCQAMFNSNTWGPDDEWFMTGRQDLMLGIAPSTAFGSLVAILAPNVGKHIHEAYRGEKP